MKTIFHELLCVLLIGLKLTGHIQWSWWLVLSPMWGTALIAIIMVVLLSVIKTLFENSERYIKEIKNE